MTEKRFTIDKDGITVIDNCTNSLTECKYSQEAKLLCNFLNEVTEDNEQLKNEVYDWKASAEDYLKLGKSLKEENEQLKKENQLIKKNIRELYKFVKVEVDNEIEVYPKALLGGIVNILKIMGDLE